MKKTYNNMNVNKLYDELVDVGIKPITVWSDLKLGQHIAENIEIVFEEDTNMTLVQQIINAHDTTPLPQPKIETEMLKERLEATELALIELMMEG